MTLVPALGPVLCRGAEAGLPVKPAAAANSGDRLAVGLCSLVESRHCLTCLRPKLK